MKNQDHLTKQLETLFSDVVVPEPDIRVQAMAGPTAEAVLAPPTLARKPRAAAAGHPRVPEHKTSPQWLVMSFTVLALAVALGLLLFGPTGLKRRNQETPSEQAAAVTGLQAAVMNLGISEQAAEDGGLTNLTPSAAAFLAAITPSSEPVEATVRTEIAAPLTRPMTLTMSIAGLPPTSEPSPLPTSGADPTDVPAVPASPTETQPPPTSDPTATATQVVVASPVGTDAPEATLVVWPTPTQGVTLEPTVTLVQIEMPTATLLPSPAPTVLQQEPPTPAWTPTVIAPPPQPVPAAPDRLVIPAINLEAPVITVGYVNYNINGQAATTFAVPDHFAVGWHHTSAPPGLPGNTVLNGHQMINGGVFRDLETLGQNDEIVVFSGGDAHHYRVAEQHLLAEEGQPLSVRVENARWIMPTGDERLTLVTCAPYGKSSHRLVVVARPSSPSP